MSLLHVAIERCEPPSISVVRLLIEKGCDIDSSGERMKSGANGITPLHLAARNPCTEIVKLLVSEGAGLQRVNNVGYAYSQTPLCSAIQQGSLGVIQDLLDAGSDVTFMTANGNKGGPLHFASTITTIELLVAEGAEVNEPDAFGDTPLHWVPLRDSRDCGELLISKGARVNAVNAKGQSPLHVAAEKGQIETIRLLREHGADTNLRDENGRTPHEVFVQSARIPWLDIYQTMGMRHLSASEKQDAKDLLAPAKKQCVIC
eukprot:GILI01024004.1.p1 GENE.GILI01024004.1~~GILI01024004.1.p1  ORF type:complete len:299 (-),score=34.98 GILI01024004.1:838-1617(-)